jgi:hypothetical protein
MSIEPGKSRGPRQQAVTSRHFWERALHYRFAAAMTEDPREVETLCGLASMFDRLACEFRQVESIQACSGRTHDRGRPAGGP